MVDREFFLIRLEAIKVINMKNKNRSYLILPLLAYSISGDKKKREIDFGWLAWTWTIIW
jgi:hypothetical protein